MANDLELAFAHYEDMVSRRACGDRSDEAVKKARVKLQTLLTAQASSKGGEAVTDDAILALNAGERFFSESPSKYPEAGFGTQYHAGKPGVLGFARACITLAAKDGAAGQERDGAVALPAGWNLTLVDGRYILEKTGVGGGLFSLEDSSARVSVAAAFLRDLLAAPYAAIAAREQEGTVANELLAFVKKIANGEGHDRRFVSLDDEATSLAHRAAAILALSSREEAPAAPQQSAAKGVLTDEQIGTAWDADKTKMQHDPRTPREAFWAGVALATPTPLAETGEAMELLAAAAEALELTRLLGGPQLPRLFAAVESVQCNQSGG